MISPVEIELRKLGEVKQFCSSLLRLTLIPTAYSKQLMNANFGFNRIRSCIGI